MRLRWLCDGTDRLNWRDVAVVIRQADDKSAIARQSMGDAYGWGVGEYLLASAVDALHGANWQRSGKGERPKPIPRPSVTTADMEGQNKNEASSGDPFNDKESGVFTGEAIPVDELNKWLGWVS
ncbi:hypothetical protein MA47_09655 [Corynebacterium auriscanis]|uniref:Uncharacterized protein n=1 Tax=Corynebacterium auriscanis TaxID=99807 RepID=A0A0A2DJQ1_9CORY|nr:hypothetical protein MA47_09655 [Corynebacterium auriscanis]